VLSHLVGSAYTVHFGLYAVRCFFVISGFVITAALNEVYHFDGIRFWTNRALRLLPPYYIVCGLTLIALILFPDQAGQYSALWKHDMQPDDVLTNLLIIPLQFPILEFRILPPYWSVAVEIVLYAIMWLVISRREECAVLALVAGITYHLASHQAGLPWEARYFTAPSAMLPFSLGALIYFLRQRDKLTISLNTSAIAFVAWLLNMIIASPILGDSDLFGTRYYANTLFFAIVVAGFAGQKLTVPFNAVDRLLGDLAYPLFLLQFLVGFLVALVFFPGVWRGWELTLVVMLLMVPASYGLVRLHERFIEPMRQKVRSDAQRWPTEQLEARARARLDRKSARAI
jgi:peptidoglycan/LPS O-acetylase OafA/YrhL